MALMVGGGVRRRGSSDDGLVPTPRQAQETNVGFTEKVGQLVLCGIMLVLLLGRHGQRRYKPSAIPLPLSPHLHLLSNSAVHALR